MLHIVRQRDTYRILENFASIKPFLRVWFQPTLIHHQLYSVALVHQCLCICHKKNCHHRHENYQKAKTIKCKNKIVNSKANTQLNISINQTNKTQKMNNDIHICFNCLMC